MSDIKLFQIKTNSVKELEGKSVQIEKSLKETKINKRKLKINESINIFE